MKSEKKLSSLLWVMLFAFTATIQAGETENIDQRQIEWFGVSTLKNVKEIYPQVALELVEKNSSKSNFTPQIGPLTQKNLQEYLGQLLNKSGIRTTNKFNAASASAPLSLNVTIYAKERNDTVIPSYAIFVYTEALQPEFLIRDNKIRSFSRTWPMVPMGDGSRALLLLTPETIVNEVYSEVTRQVRNFIIDYSNANPGNRITIPVFEKPQKEPEQNNSDQTQEESLPEQRTI